MVLRSSISIPVPEVNLLSWVFEGPEYDKNKDIYIDVLDDTRRLTARQAESFARKLISGFKAHGVKDGDSILIHSFGDVMYPIIYLGIVGAGGRFVGSNPSSTPQELNHMLNLTSTRYVLVSPPFLPSLLQAITSLSVPIPNTNIFIFDTPHNPSIPPGFQSWRELLENGEGSWKAFTDVESSKETIASLFSTSGTTGLPKVAAVSHYASIARCIASYDPKPKDYLVSRLMCLPMFHGVAATASHIDPLRFGIPTYILPRFSISPFLSAIRKYQITETGVVPAVLSILNQSNRGAEEDVKRDLKTLKLLRCAGAPLDVEVQRKFAGLLDSEARIVAAWGLTEFGTVTSFFGKEKDDTGSVGRLTPNSAAKILDKKGKEIETDGEPGDVLVSGPSMMSQYLGNNEATESAFADGWLKTGDIAYRNEGKWYIVDRSKDMIKVRGWQVAPAEIERCLIQHPLVFEASVIGVKSTTQETELPRAYVVLKQASDLAMVTETELKELVAARLANYKTLDGGVKFVDSLPKTASGKIMKRVLREEASKDLSRSKSLCIS